MSQAIDSSTAELLVVDTEKSRLYAFLLKLRPLQQGTLFPFNGEPVHGAFLLSPTGFLLRHRLQNLDGAGASTPYIAC